MEYWDVYNKYKQKTGKIIISNNKELAEDEYGMFVQVAIFNSNNEMLIQQRQNKKEKYPNLWDISASGHVLAGEDANEALERKLFEEIGFKYNCSEERSYFTINCNKEFEEIFILKNINVDINDLKINYDEVQNVTWANKEEIIKLLDEGKFINYSQGYIELLFYQIEKRGVK